MNDIQLLRQYAGRASEDAFTLLVNRYVNLVFSAALRQSGDSRDAEENTQAVFLILARKVIGALTNEIVIPEIAPGADGAPFDLGVLPLN